GATYQLRYGDGRSRPASPTASTGRCKPRPRVAGPRAGTCATWRLLFRASRRLCLRRRNRHQLVALVAHAEGGEPGLGIEAVRIESRLPHQPARPAGIAPEGRAVKGKAPIEGEVAERLLRRRLAAIDHVGLGRLLGGARLFPSRRWR